MDSSIEIIPLARLALAFIPVILVLGIFFRWSLDYANVTYAVARMLIQLMLIGYFLAYIFATDSAWLVMAVMAVMICAASWIALQSVAGKRRSLYGRAVAAILVGGGLTLALVTQGVLSLEPWFMPRYFIPLAGMIFANAMNSVSLAAERYFAETARQVPHAAARGTAFRTSLIPITNALFAVGLVSLPGMMTGQILSGISPLIAARYQIMVMCMVFGAAGISSAIFLLMINKEEKKE